MDFSLLIKNLPALFAALFTAILFIQSGLNKVFDWKGNLEWLTGHFSKTFVAGMVPMMLATITVLEICESYPYGRHDIHLRVVHTWCRLSHRALLRPADRKRLSRCRGPRSLLYPDAHRDGSHSSLKKRKGRRRRRSDSLLLLSVFVSSFVCFVDSFLKSSFHETHETDQ
jgi:hypothetical protein